MHLMNTKRMSKLGSTVPALVIVGAMCWSYVVLAAAISLRGPLSEFALIAVAILAISLPVYLMTKNWARSALIAALVSMVLCGTIYRFCVMQRLPQRVVHHQPNSAM